MCTPLKISLHRSSLNRGRPQRVLRRRRGQPDGGGGRTIVMPHQVFNAGGMLTRNAICNIWHWTIRTTMARMRKVTMWICLPVMDISWMRSVSEKMGRVLGMARHRRGVATMTTLVVVSTFLRNSETHADSKIGRLSCRKRPRTASQVTVASNTTRAIYDSLQHMPGQHSPSNTFPSVYKLKSPFRKEADNQPW